MITLTSSELLYPPFPQLLKLRGQYEELEEQVEVARKENKHLQGWCDTCLECLALGFSLLSGNVTSIPLSFVPPTNSVSICGSPV